MIIDTHVHTTCSDGKASVPELMRIAAENDVSILSITDHDTVDAYPDAFKYAARYDVCLVPGVELSTKDEDGHKDVHIVGLKIDLDDSSLREELEKLAFARIDARKKLLDNANKYLREKYDQWEPLEFGDVKKTVFGNVIGKPHIARAIASKAKLVGIDIPEEDLYEIFDLPGVKTGKSYELTMEQCISLIKGAGGVPVLAHPCEYRDMDAVVEKFARLGGEAIEICKYRYKTKIDHVRVLDPKVRLDIERKYNKKTINAANRYRLNITASSDYHGRVGEPGMDIDEYGIDVSWLLDGRR
ncbi:metal-dependent phosphoesterase [Methanocella sp. CWC-04]|uniref:Metal-dependent phosphoesterase n=1 Tax=Methanooceanicella nereidis TaxID=2052831 RepID=A0AAP2RF40_9EURY|nr:PHP domain-containing protein [Methanocella sp. CWC-04]MCD1294940.1 metal-dependent phosphoesterase [Methanocella sp. CWC-04]